MRETQANPAQQILFRHTAILKMQFGQHRSSDSQHPIDRLNRKTRTFSFHEKSRALSLTLTEDQKEIGDLPERYPLLVTIQKIRIAGRCRCGCHAPGITADAGFGQTEPSDHFARREFSQPLLLLRLTAPSENSLRDHIMDRQETAQG